MSQARSQPTLGDVQRIVTETTKNVVSLAPRKRSRGRPRKPLIVAQPCPHDFNLVATAIVGIARQKVLWNAAKERVRRWADRNRALRPVSRCVIGYVLEKINKAKGFDWHGRDSIAADLGVSGRAVEYAFSELGKVGLILRKSETVGGTKASRRWRTTVPAMLDAAREVSAEREAKQQARLGRFGVAGEAPEQKKEMEPNKKDRAPEQERPEAPEQQFGLTLKEEPEKESKRYALDAFKSRSGEDKEHGVRTGSALREGCVQQIAIPILRPPPRYDRSLPMDHRVFIPGGRYALPQTPDEKALLRKMKQAARGWDLHDLRGKYCKWAVSANTGDAVEGFIAWMLRYQPKPAPNQFRGSVTGRL